LLNCAFVELQKINRYDKKAVKRAKEILSGEDEVTGMGHMKIQSAIRFAAALFLIPQCYEGCGIVEESPSGKSGPVLFIKRYSEFPDGDPKATDLVDKFETVYKEVNYFVHATRKDADQGMCLGSHKERVDENTGKVLDKRKKDLILFDDANDFNSLQNIFRYLYKNGKPTDWNRVQFRFRGQWKNLSNIIEKIGETPGEGKTPRDDEIWLKWKKPTWYRDIIGGYKKGMVQCVF